MQSNNAVHISAAGSGKTTYLVKEAIKNPSKKIAIITYTIDNLNEIRRSFVLNSGAVPSNVTIQSWFSFLLTEGVRPYQLFKYDKRRIESIKFENGRSAIGIPKTNTEKYFLAGGQYIYTDKISEFTCLCNISSKGLVIKRLSEIYDCIYIDEVQDLAGYDFDFLELLLESKIQMVLVGDNRQATFSTNNSAKYSKFKGKNIIDLFKKWEGEKKCLIHYRNDCFRSNQSICDFADSLYPDMPKTISHNKIKTGHDGVFSIQNQDVDSYIRKFVPRVLRYDKRTFLPGINALNFGVSKGLTFDRVLILSNGPIGKYLQTAVLTHVEPSKAKLYVAITRARYSVAFLFDGSCVIPNVSHVISSDLN